MAAGAYLEPCTATLAPASAKAMAIAAPNPRDEPVTRADLPLRLNRSRIRSGSFPAWPRRNSTCLYYVRAEWGGVETVVKSIETQDLFDGLEARLAALYFNEPSTARLPEWAVGGEAR